MTRLLPLLAIMALFLGLVSVVHAQATTPTVSTVAITSNPGMDNTYTTLDVITVGVTFSEAVTVTGTPQITLDIGGTERTADYSGAGTATGQLLFSYTVQPVDQDDDGVAVVANSLALNGGTIQSADGSTGATLTHSAMAFPSHKVDTELVLISNMGQADGTALRINAGERVRLSFEMWASGVIYDLNQIVLDVKTPSDTLNLGITTVVSDDPGNLNATRRVVATFTGSVATAGKQRFRSSNFTYAVTNISGIITAYIPGAYVEVYLTASGSGYVELGTTASMEEDSPGAYRWSIADSVYRSTDGGTTYTEQTSAHLPRLSVVGHTTETLRILAADIVSEPYDGVAYAAGERIEARIFLNGAVRALATPLTVPLHFGDEAQHRREAGLATIRGDYTSFSLHPTSPQLREYVLYFAYTVQPGDMDTDGVVLGANPLGTESDGKIEYALDTRVRMELSFPAQGPSASHLVNGEQTSACDAVHCAYLTAVEGIAEPPYIFSGYFAPAKFRQLTGNISGRLFSYGGREYFFRRNSVYFNPSTDGGAGDSEIVIWFTQPLQDLSVQRLGWQAGDTAFAFADAETSLFDAPTSEEDGFEHVAEYSWSTTGLRWNPGDRILVKIVEMPVTATFDAATYAADEGGSVEVTVALGGSFETKTVTLPIRAAGSGGATAADYSGIPANLVFAPGDTEKSFTVTLTDDDVDDDGESLTLSFGSESNIKSGGANETATVAIRDDDDPAVTVSFGASTYTAAEGGTATVTVTLSADPERTVEVPITKTNQGGASAADYSGVPASVTFDAGDTSKTFTFTAVQDTVDDDDESVDLAFGTLPSRVSAGTTAETAISITDDDDPEVTVSFDSATYTREVDENTGADQDVGSPVTASDTQSDALTYTLGGADAASFEIASTSGQIQTKAGVTYDHEAKSSYTVTVTASDGNGGTATATVTITINDVNEPPLAPTEVDGVAVPRTYDQITVFWTAPDNAGRPPITGYDVQYVAEFSVGGTYLWTDWPQSVQGTFATITGLEHTSTFPVRVRAKNDEGDSPWAVIGGLYDDYSDELQLPRAGTNLLPHEIPIGHGFIPPGSGLGTGDSFRLLFVSYYRNMLLEQQNATDATAQSIWDYYDHISSHVIDENAPSEGLSIADYSLTDLHLFYPFFFPVASTKLVDAGVLTNTTYTNDDKGVPIYWVGGSKVADDYEDFYDGSWDDEANVRDATGALITAPARVWTGSASDGTALMVNGVSHALGQPQAGYATPGSTVSGAGPLHSGSTAANTEEYPMYGLSTAFRIVALGQVSNLGQSGRSTDERSARRSQRFTTGAHLHGYENLGIQIAYRGAENRAGYSLSIYTVDTSGHPGTRVANLTYPDADSGQELTFDAPDNTVLDPNTTYAIVVTHNTATDEVTLSATTSDDEDDEGEDDWSISDAFDIESGGSWSADTDGRSLRIRVRATLKVGPPGKPTGLTANAVGRDRINLSWTAPSMDGGSAITGYLVESSADGSMGWTDVVADTGTTTTSYSHTGLHPNTTLYYRVSAINVEGTSGASDTANATTDDFPDVTVQFRAATYTVAEGSSTTVTVTLSEDPLQTTVIPLAASGQGGASSADYSGVPASVTFNAGQTSTTITFSATQDTEDDDGESVKLAFGALPTGVSAGATAETTVAIRDDDDPQVTVSFGAATYTAAEGGTVTVTVTLSADPERMVEVPITTTNQGGAVAADYSGVPATVTFNSGDTSKTFTFTAAQDTADDDGESVELGFGSSLPAGVSEGSPSETTVSIRDDDDPQVTVSFGAATYRAIEGSTAAVTVELSADPERTVEVPITKTNERGVSDSDYSGVPATVTFNSGDTEKTITFTATADSLNESGERVKLSFGTLPTRVSEGTPAETTVTISDSTQAQTTLPTIHFGSASYTVSEGGSVDVTVTLSKAPGSEAVIPLTASNQGGATASDYSGVPTSVTFGAAETSRTFTVTAAQDTADDDGESILLGFGTLPGGITATTGQAAATTVSIRDDDDPAVTVSFGAATYRAAEGGTATVTVTLSADPERTVEVPITTTNQGGATSADYSGVPATVTFNAGETSQPITFAATQDTEDDDGESVKLGFGTLPARVSEGSPSETTVSIRDDDDPQVTVSFGAATYRAIEGSTAAVTVELSSDPERTVEVPITKTNERGVSDSDYSGVPATVTFNSGDTEKTITFTATADSLNESGERVKLSFGTLPTRVSEGTPAETTVTISDSTQAQTTLPTIHFGSASYTVSEGGSVDVTVTLSKAPGSEAVIPLTASNQGGATASDYSGVPTSVTFGAAETSRTFTVTAAQDTADDDGESVLLGFGTLPGGITATTGEAAETTVSITDDDDPQVTVSFGAATYRAAEGGTATVTVTLSADPERTVAVPITTTNQGGATSADYSGVPATVTFNAGETSQPITFAATQDTEDDDGESVKLAFGALPTGVSAGATDETTVSIRDDDDPQVTVSFGASTYTAAEGGTATVTVTLSADPERTVEVRITTTNQGGASASDYSGVPASVTFATGETEQTITFTAVQDTVDDDDESVLLGFGTTLPARVSAVSPSETTVSIRDDDDPAVTVSFGASTYTAAEGGTATVTVTLSADPERTVEVPITTTNQGGASAADYSGVPVSVTFNAGDTSQPITFAAAQDTADDDGESVLLGFGTLPGGITATTGEAAETTVSITDDDDPQVTVSFGASTYTAAEGGTATVTVTLSADPERTVTVPLTKTEQGGASSADYSGVPASVTFNAGETSQPITFAATQDTEDDDGESVKLAFGALPTGVSAGARDETTVSITDDDDPAVTVSFGAATYTAAEGGTATVTVTLSADPERTVEVRITTTNQGGASASDYSGVPASVTFATGETEQTITFTAVQDTVDDDGESVRLAFGTSLPVGVSEGSPSETTVSITDDDDPQVTVSFGASTYTAAEGGTATVTVTLSADPERTVEVPITTTNQGGASAADYSGVPVSVTFDAGETSQPITFAAAQDTADDDGESVLLGFGTLPGGITATTGEAAETTVSITDDDDPQVTVSFGASTYTAAEGGTATVTVTLSADPERTVAIPLTKANEGGASAADYSGVPATVTFNAGETSQPITFAATQDAEDDDGESVKLAFGALPTAVTAGARDETTVSITDDDDPAVTVSFGAATYTAAEGGTATVRVTLNADPERTVAVPLTKTEQGGASAADYSGVPASVTFNAGETSQPITFAATQDAEDDDGESVKLAFGALPTGVSAGARDETTVSITDDDDPQVTVSFGASTYTAAEGGTATVTVDLSADPERTVAVPVTKTNQGGAVAADYSGVPATVTFNSGDTSKTFTFTATQDMGDDDGESVKLAFGKLPSGVRAGATDETTVSITDNDDPDVTVSFGASTYTAAEGDTATVTVTLSADPERTVAIPLTKTNQGGATSADYSGVPTSVTFDAGDTSKTFDFAATQDAEDDDGESVKLAFGTSLPVGVSAGSPSETTVSITDDDDPQVTVSFGAATYRAIEGGTATVTVELSADPERTVEVRITATNQGGATSADYSGVPASVTFNTGDTSKTFTFTATQDMGDDDGESVKLAFGKLPSGVSMGSPSETTVTIRQVSTEFILSCGLAVWCADMRFSDGTAVDWGWSRLRYEKDWDPPATVSDDTFTFRGVEYTLRRVDVHPGTYPIMPNAWSRTKQGYSYISLRITRGDYWDPPPREHYRDWVLHLDGLELPFKDAFRAGDEFQWIGVAFQELFNDWISSTVTKIGIEEVAATAQEPTPVLPYAPIAVEAFAAGRNALYVRWDPPWWRVGVPDATGYIVQWKEAADSWSDSAAVSQREVRGGWQGLQQLDGLTEGALYSVRVFATNAAGDGPPSEDTLGRPQPLNPRLDSMSVNGRTLTMRYDRRLDGNSVPASTAFVVLVNGGLRTVDTVAVRGMEVVLTLAEGVSAANTVIARYEPPTDPAAAFLRDTEGNYVFTSKRDGLKEVANETPRSSLQPLTASFSNVPSSHDGSGSFTFNIGFSEPVWIGTGFPRAHLLVVTRGTVTSAHWLERRTDEWAVTIRPDGSGDIVITLPKDRYCVADLHDSIRQENLVPGAPCAAGNRPLTNEPTATVTGTSSEQHDTTENTPAEGAPRIQGDPAVGETFSADTTGITDADGLNHAVFAYQWLADDAEIDGATGSTYTPTSGDAGKTITVRVTFTDDAGNEESLTSAATEAVAAGLDLQSATLDGATLTLNYNEILDSSVTLPATAFTVSLNGGSRSVSAVSVSGSAVTLTLASEAAAGDTVTVEYVRPEGRHFIRDIRGRVAPSFSARVVSNDTAPDQPEESEEQADPLTASAHGVPASHDGSAAFTFELRFSETPADGFSYKTLRDHAFTVTGGEVVKARRLERGKNVRWEITVRPDGDGTVTIVLPVTEDCASNHAICTEDGRPLSNRLQIAVPGPEG